MKADKISEAMNYIDDDIITEADSRRKSKKRKTPFLKWAAAAACVCVAGYAGFRIMTERANINDAPIDTSLPILTVEKGMSGSMGFEGYLAYDFDELENGNPWDESWNPETMPVYINSSFTKFGIPCPGIGKEAMLEKLHAAGESLGVEVTDVEYEMVGDFTEGFSGFVLRDTLYSAEAETDTVRIRVEADGSVVAYFGTKENRYNDGLALPEKYNFTHTGTSDSEAMEVIDYICETYRDYIGLSEPLAVTGGDYSFSGEFIRYYRVYDSSGDNLDDMLSYFFSYVQIAPNDSGNLMLIRVYDYMSCAEKVGDYPIISVQEAQELLIDGGYLTTVPYEFPGEKHIAGVELVYRVGGSDNVWMPYYRFYVDLPDQTQENGLHCFGAYYVPAVELQYIEGLQLWDERFN
ncbi:MAG: hypothetical protein ACI4QZ_09280 [Eubacteriales bacterium]